MKGENKLQEVSEINEIFLVVRFQNKISRREVLLKMKQYQVLNVERKGPKQLCQGAECADAQL